MCSVNIVTGLVSDVCVALISCSSFIVLLSRLISEFRCSNWSRFKASLVESMSPIKIVAYVKARAGGVVHYPASYPVREYISPYVPCHGKPNFSIMAIEHTLTLKIGDKERETGYAGWRC